MPSGSPKARSHLVQQKARLWAVGLGALAAGFLLLLASGSSRMDEIVLKNGKGVEVHIIRRGAIITRILLPDSTTSAPVDVVLGFDEEQPYKVREGQQWRTAAGPAGAAAQSRVQRAPFFRNTRCAMLHCRMALRPIWVHWWGGWPTALPTRPLPSMARRTSWQPITGPTACMVRNSPAGLLALTWLPGKAGRASWPGNRGPAAAARVLGGPWSNGMASPCRMRRRPAGQLEAARRIDTLRAWG